MQKKSLQKVNQRSACPLLDLITFLSLRRVSITLEMAKFTVAAHDEDKNLSVCFWTTLYVRQQLLSSRDGGMVCPEKEKGGKKPFHYY